MLSAHYAAFKTRLEAAPFLTGKVDTSVRVTTGLEAVRANYAVAFPAGPEDIQRRFTQVQTLNSRLSLTYRVRFVAVDADGCLLLADAGLTQLLGHTLTVTGRVCDPIRIEDADDQVTHDPKARLFYMDIYFAFESSPSL